jgi:hypothetical protein
MMIAEADLDAAPRAATPERPVRRSRAAAARPARLPWSVVLESLAVLVILFVVVLRLA